MPKGQRPPPFDGPPTAVSCGGEAWGDDVHLARLMDRFENALEMISQLAQWSIEVLGLRVELAKRYKLVMDVAKGRSKEVLAQINFCRMLANSKCDELESDFFNSTPISDTIAVSVEAGWVGTYDSETSKIISRVRNNLTNIYREIRDRTWMRSAEDREYLRALVRRIDGVTHELFTITGPDEYGWKEWIDPLHEAARHIKDRAFDLSGV